MAAKKLSKKTSTQSRPSAVGRKTAATAKKAVATAKQVVATMKKAATAKKAAPAAGPVRAAKPAKPSAPKPGPAGPSRDIGAGSEAPPFELPDQNGQRVSAKDLAGEPYVLYFYPRDNTPGCTREACDFRDGLARFAELGVRVVGVSPDSVKSHRGFADKFGLPFTLLADTDRALADAYGVYKMKKLYGKESMGIERSTFLVGGDGRVRAAWRGVKVPDHVEAVLAAAVRAGA